jgi:mono/diheme cytochrome c family protein
MPSEVFTHISEEDLGAIIAYLRQVTPVDREVPKSGFGPVGRALLAAGKMNILVAGKTPRITPPASVPRETTAEYGKYLADISGCHGCHGYGLSGGRVAGPPGLPPASNLTPTGIGDWTEADLVRALREGKRRDGSQLDEFMPWAVYRGMTDAEIRSLWLYLRSVPPKPFGNK